MLAHPVSVTVQADYCVKALREAIAQYGAPEIVNTDQGSQFTSEELIAKLKKHDVAISKDGRGQRRDSVFVERLWTSVKYEAVYLRTHESVSAARAGIAAYFEFNNPRRSHSAHAAPVPDVVYFDTLAQPRAAA